MRRGFGIRLLASGIDAVFGVVVALLLSGTLGRWFAERAGVMLAIGSPDTFWRGPVPMMLGYLGSLIHGLPLAFLLVLLPEALFGAGPGKWVLGLSVAARDRAASPGARWLRWTIKCSGPVCMLLALLIGSAALAFIAIIATVIAGAGSLLALGSRSLALHDRLSGTSVVSFEKLRPFENLTRGCIMGNTRRGC